FGYDAHLDYYGGDYHDEAVEDAAEIARIAYEQRLVALAAAEAGEQVEWSPEELEVMARSVSLVQAGVPTLFSVLSPELLKSGGLVVEFDLDGDGTYETTAPAGTVWATFDEPGSHAVSARVLDPG